MNQSSRRQLHRLRQTQQTPLNNIIQKLSSKLPRNITQNQKRHSLTRSILLLPQQLRNLIRCIGRKSRPPLIDPTNRNHSVPANIRRLVRQTLRNRRHKRRQQVRFLELRRKPQRCSPQILIWMQQIVPQRVTNQQKLLLQLALSVPRLHNFIVQKQQLFQCMVLRRRDVLYCSHKNRIWRPIARRLISNERFQGRQLPWRVTHFAEPLFDFVPPGGRRLLRRAQKRRRVLNHLFYNR